MVVDAKYIMKYKREAIKQYKEKWHTMFNVQLIPMDVTAEMLETIFKIMVDTGYTFLTAYYIHKNNGKCKVVSIDDIIIHKNRMSQPLEKTLQKKRECIRTGDISNIVLNKKNELIDGYATLLLFKQFGEKFIPYETNDILFYDTHSSNIEHRKILYNQSNGRCYICGRETKFEEEYKNTDIFATVDHLKPVAKGGTNRLSNLKLCCQLCNSLKGSFTYSEELKAVIIKELQERKLI